jgi:hypothetical protein
VSGSITNSNPDTSSEMYDVDLEIPVPENLRISPDINKSGSDNLSLSPEVTLLDMLSVVNQFISFVDDISTET